MVGTLDMREWRAVIDTVDALTQEVVAAGLFSVAQERRFAVADEYNDGREFLATVGDWRGTRVEPWLADAVASADGVQLHQDVRLRVYRAE